MEESSDIDRLLGDQREPRLSRSCSLTDLPATLIWLDRTLAVFPIPGGHRSLGWLHLLRAHVLRQLDDADGSMISAAAAQTVFSQLGEQRGLAAVQKDRPRVDVELERYSLRIAVPTMRPPSAAGVHVSLLGGFSVVVNGRAVEDRWRLRKAKMLVKLLALAPGHRLHRDSVVDRL